jgi:hypothetical protein
MHADGTALTGILRLTIWGIDSETGEVELGSEEIFRFIFSGVRLH